MKLYQNFKVILKLKKLIFILITTIVAITIISRQAQGQLTSSEPFKIALTSSPTPAVHTQAQAVPQSKTNWLQRSFESNSLLWLLISSILGGIVGASIKLLFEVLLPSHLQQRREIIAIKRKYTTPILLAAEALRNRLHNMIRLIERIQNERWLSYENKPGYYYLSTIYLVGRFFGWVEILRRTVVYLDLSTIEETGKFEKYLEAIEFGFSNPDLVLDLNTENTTKRRNWCYSLELSNIGELIILQEGKEGEYYTLGFGAFKSNFFKSENIEFREAFDSLGFIFRDLKASDVQFQRLVATYNILNTFVDYLDPHHIRTEKREYHWDKLSEEQREALHKRINKIDSVSRQAPN